MPGGTRRPVVRCSGFRLWRRTVFTSAARASPLVRYRVRLPVRPRLPRRRRVPRGVEHADAAVPAEDGVVIAGGAEAFGLGVVGERLVEERADRREREARREPCPGLPLATE